MVTNYEGEQVVIPEVLPMLPVRDIVVFPYMIIPLFVGRDSSIQSVEEALARTDRLILLASQKDISDEHPAPDGIYKLGTVAMIMRDPVPRSGRRWRQRWPRLARHSA